MVRVDSDFVCLMDGSDEVGQMGDGNGSRQKDERDGSGLAKMDVMDLYRWVIMVGLDRCMNVIGLD